MKELEEKHKNSKEIPLVFINPSPPLNLPEDK